MNKSVLATLGVVGACAACCAIPLAIPLVSGLSVAGVTSMDWEFLTMSSTGASVGAGLAAAAVVGGGMWWQRRRVAAANCAAATTAAATAVGCGCGSQAPKELT